MIIYIDSNIFFDDPYLAKTSFSVLLAKVKEKNGLIKMSEVVYSETLNNLLSKNIVVARDGIQKSDRQLTKYLAGSGLEEKYRLPLINDEEISESFHKRYKDLTNDGVLEIINHDSIDKDYLIKDIMHRALHCIRPFSKGKEEFKDTMIWHTIIEDIKKNGYKKCFFISGNNSDFFNKESDDKNINKEFHKDLLKDIPTDVDLVPFQSLKDIIDEIERSSEKLDNTSSMASSLKLVRKEIAHDDQVDIDEEFVKFVLENNIYYELESFFQHVYKLHDGTFEVYFPLMTKELNYISDIEEFYENVLMKVNKLSNISAYKIEDSIKVFCTAHVTAVLDFIDIRGKYSEQDYEENEFIISVTFSVDDNHGLTDFDISEVRYK
ncbi:PIN domain-containing protein [Exiguobacterium sp. S90]|uniref:PIN domain-containing protein n=1 Tax=Exiguobacterium sp. S90 TaxID=1221231 RepID=UPI001BE7FC46|nr:PIN domain-containing protein [Exiguobacterium sp. S90]